MSESTGDVQEERARMQHTTPKMNSNVISLTLKYGLKRVSVTIKRDTCVFEVALLAINGELGVSTELENVNLVVRDRNISLSPYARISDVMSRSGGDVIEVLINHSRTSLESSQITAAHDDDLELSGIRDELASFLDDLVLYGDLC